MWRTLTIVGVLLFLLGAGACDGNKIDEMISQGDAFKTRMCACTDVACVNKVVQDLSDWKKGLDEKAIEEAGQKLSLEEQGKMKAKIDAIGNELEACQAKWEDKGLQHAGE